VSEDAQIAANAVSAAAAVAQAAAAAAATVANAAREAAEKDDPTVNVLALVRSTADRQDDLRTMSDGYRYQLTTKTEHFQEKFADLRAHYDNMLRTAESDRLNAIRLVDTGNVARATAEADQRASTLAGQVAAAADAVRTTLEAARTQAADTLSAAVDPLKVDIADLRRVQYQQAGERASQTEIKNDKQWLIPVVVTIIGLCLTAAGVFMSAAVSLGIYFTTH